ncbi:MAG: DUF6541 family protein, partial [Raoultibacter sp.]
IARVADFVRVSDERRSLVRVLLCVSFLAFVAMLWLALFEAPFMQKVVTHDWPTFLSKSQAVVDALTLSFNVPAVQLLLAALVLAGIIYTLFKRRYLWVSCSFVLMILLYVVGTSFEGYLKFLMTGFWYTDSYRVAASAAFAAIPLAALGLSATCSALSVGLSWLALRMKSGTPPAWVAPCVVATLFLAANFYPNFMLSGRYAVNMAFGFVAEKLTLMNDMSRANIYGPDEREFIQEALRTIPSGSVVVNEPNDGSAFAYGVDGIYAVYRNLRTYGGDNETEDSKIIRKRLSEIEKNDQVKSAVKRSGAQYLLLLDQGDVGRKEPYPFTYHEEDWTGVNAVDDKTPGFEIVLSEGDMRLYKISAMDEG